MNFEDLDIENPPVRLGIFVSNKDTEIIRQNLLDDGYEARANPITGITKTGQIEILRYEFKFYKNHKSITENEYFLAEFKAILQHWANTRHCN